MVGNHFVIEFLVFLKADNVCTFCFNVYYNVMINVRFMFTMCSLFGEEPLVDDLKAWARTLNKVIST